MRCVNYCTIKQAAKMLRVSRPTVYRMIRDGELKKYHALGRPALDVAQVKKAAQKVVAK